MANAQKNSHEAIERNVALMIVLTLLTVSVGGLVEIVPLFFQHSLTKPVVHTKDAQGKPVQVEIKPYDALRLAGRDIYIREGCYNCHSQMVRPFRAETERYGHFSVAAESIYDHPFQWGSKRTGPDLARVGGRYSDSWHRDHLLDPRSVVPDSNMPAFPWLNRPVDASMIKEKMQTLRIVGVPYTDAEISAAPGALKGKSEMDALVAYLQGLGTALSNFK